MIFNPLVSLADTFVADRGRFRPGSAAARALAAVDRHALRSADLVVADTRANADHLAGLAGLPPERVEVAYVGAEERVFGAGWSPVEPFTVLFVGKLIPLHGLETVLAAARAASELRFRLVGSGQLEPLVRERPANVDWIPWVEYERLPDELHRAGCALGIFGTSAKAQRVIPNKAFQALACGTPLVTADTPGARELLVDGESALLVPPGDPEALAERPAPACRRRRAGREALGRRPRRLRGARERRGARPPLARARRAGGRARVIRPRALLWTAVAAYAAGFSALSILRHRAFSTGRFDLGNMVQAVWSTAHGHPLQITGLRGDQVSRLGAHFDPILAAFAPLWLLWPSPDLLLVDAGGRSRARRAARLLAGAQAPRQRARRRSASRSPTSPTRRPSG